MFGGGKRIVKEHGGRQECRDRAAGDGRKRDKRARETEREEKKERGPRGVLERGPFTRGRPSRRQRGQSGCPRRPSLALSSSAASEGEVGVSEPSQDERGLPTRRTFLFFLCLRSSSCARRSEQRLLGERWKGKPVRPGAHLR